MPARLDLLHTRRLTLAARVVVHDGDSGVRAMDCVEGSGSWLSALKSYSWEEEMSFDNLVVTWAVGRQVSQASG